ncbi:MAG: hypothetical protein AAGA54_11190 [Myxococcota bacterium]
MRFGAIVVAGLSLSIAGCTWSTTPKTSPSPKPTTTRPAAQPKPKAQPQQPAPNPMVEVASRFQHSCARRSSGDVLCWGKNTYGQLGNGGRVDSPRLMKVRGLANIKQVEVGRDFSCALERGGTIKCWGNNEDGQLGDGRGGSPGALSLTPVTVRGLKGVAEISLGEYHGCARTKEGTVKCWGNAENGQISDDSQRVFGSPMSIDRLGKIKQVASGASHVCALETNGKVKCWGRNTEGQLGDGKSGSRIKAVEVAGVRDGVALVSGDHHSCVLRKGGAVACWGNNSDGQLGMNGKEKKHGTPVAMVGLENVAQLAAGDRHSCARLNSGRVVCWGSNDQGQIGGPRSGGRLKPGPVRGVGDAVDISLGLAHTCAARKTGQVACWGSNEHAALGPHRLAKR